MPKKILVVDDSALMRRVLCDIIDTDIRFQVADRAKDGLEAFDLLSRNSYDAVVLDVNMPRMNGLQLLQELRKYKIPARDGQHRYEGRRQNHSGCSGTGSVGFCT